MPRAPQLIHLRPSENDGLLSVVIRRTSTREGTVRQPTSSTMISPGRRSRGELLWEPAGSVRVGQAYDSRVRGSEQNAVGDDHDLRGLPDTWARDRRRPGF